MDEDKSGRHAKIAVICCCVVIMLSMFISMWRHGAGNLGFGSFFIAVVLGVIAATAGFFAARTLDL
jgi:hypothetical protein